ncbi:NAD(P)/FAD-dependent oxidoreductase [Leptolyngbya sp. NIES-2104]|uniref:NAD(P)/FAD-dependent oxidoreductase n=1 Tax=Leptolyngbya sp. NIES-2104 TaxID=1552121 RepID=UPI0006ECBC1B|nr:FAD-dependent oxidoreductase [Leptolyngbya sp. NIES-2104]GAP94928.1 D-amino acid dehydrogenase small subunit [Leptolyngbya sp. NIES-2104]
MRITIVGCGVVGATIAYELSKISDLEITVVDAQPTPVQADLTEYPNATGAALGVLMGAISKKEKGRNLRMRLAGIQYYNETVSELEELTGRSIPFNRQGILMLQFSDDLEVWHRLVEVRRKQDLALEVWNQERLKLEFPFLDRAVAAIYSPSDRQINPVALTQALIEGAKLRGVNFQFGTKVIGRQNQQIQTSQGVIESDYVVISAGVGTSGIEKIDIRPVLGQAIHVRLPKPLSDKPLPVITGDDVHIVTLGNSEYWVGATVEFPTEAGEVLPPDRAMFDEVMRQAIKFCPALKGAEIVRSWFGLRPRPQGRPAPVIEEIEPNVLLATGHYRNGVLLAPATAAEVQEKIIKKL